MGEESVSLQSHNSASFTPLQKREGGETIGAQHKLCLLLRRKELVSADFTFLCTLPEKRSSLMLSQWHSLALKASVGSPGLVGFDPADLGLTSCVTLDP